jgi:NAD(P)-dependent dehydrogenase (short-subunit alcohol dehydrogenase family)
MAQAGVMALPPQKTQQGHELQFGINQLGHFALTEQLMPLLVNSSAGRIVVVSSIMHKCVATRCGCERHRAVSAHGMGPAPSGKAAWTLTTCTRSARPTSVGPSTGTADTGTGRRNGRAEEAA